MPIAVVSHSATARDFRNTFVHTFTATVEGRRANIKAHSRSSNAAVNLLISWKLRSLDSYSSVCHELGKGRLWDKSCDQNPFFSLVDSGGNLAGNSVNQQNVEQNI